jgi:outer membrane protein
LITDSGRTSNWWQFASAGAGRAQNFASHALRRAAAGESRLFRRAARAGRTVKVAEETVSARQLVSDQVTELAKNKLKSQLDVSFADVNVSEAKLLLLARAGQRAGALAELGRAMGSDQPANYQLSEEPLPQARRPPPTIGRPGHRQPARTRQPAAFRAMPPTSSRTPKRI